MAQRKRRSAAAAELVDLTLVNQSSVTIPRKFLVDWVNAVALEIQSLKSKDKRVTRLQWSGAELTIAFLDPEQAKELNKMYRERDYATDVLSFGDPAPGVLGELAICPQVVQQQAREHGLTFQQELGYMVLHGILHLLGFDHEKSKREEKIMFEIQDSIFEKLRK